MGRMRLFALSILASLSLSCTREVPEKLTLSLSVPSTSNSSLAQPLRLGFIVINMRTNGGNPGGQLSVVKYNGEQFGPVGPGGGIQIIIPGFKVPRDPQLMIQYFGVFQADDAGMQFSYGRTIVNSDTNGPIPAKITANMVGNASRRANVMGRYDFTTSDFRNGIVLMEFTDTNGDPPVEIEATDMVNGWFNTIAVDSAGAIRHKFFNDDGSAPVNIFGGDTSVTLMNSLAVNPQVAKVDMPVRTRKEISGFETDYYEPRLEPPQDIFVGFFNGGAGCVQYPATDLYLSGVYDPSLVTPLQYKGTGGTPGTDPMVSGGGQTGACGGTLHQDHVILNPRWLNSEGNEPHGIAAPFVALGDYDEYPLYARARVVDNASNPRIKLRWKYLPGLTATHIDGAEIFIKRSPNGDGFGGGDKDSPCRNVLLSQGYQLLADQTGINESFDADTTAEGNNFSYDYMSPDYYRDYKFAICPYRDTATSPKAFYGMYAEVHDTEDSREVNPLSFGDGTEGPQNVTTSVGFTAWGERVSNVGVPGDDYTRITLSTTIPTPAVGDEVYFQVMGGGGTGQCGYRHDQTGNGQYEIQPDQFHFARVHATGLAAQRYIDIRSGSWLDNLNNANLGGVSTGTFCYVQALQVRHFESATFSSAGELTASAFDFASNNAGGMILVRIADILSLDGTPASGSWFNADGAGYRSGGTNEYGHGIGGSKTAASNQSGGFSSAGNGGGGGGGFVDAGDGANNAASAGLGLQGPPFGPQPVFRLGGGGASDDGGPSGHGGGMVMVASRAVHFIGTAPIASANGMQGSGGTGGGGGGGGGSVNLITERLTRTATQTFDAYANGGAGGTGTNGGGGGGGGVVRAWGCDFWNGDMSSVTPVFQGNGGAAGSGTTAGNAGQNTGAGFLMPFYGPGCVPDP